MTLENKDYNKYVEEYGGGIDKKMILLEHEGLNVRI